MASTVAEPEVIKRTRDEDVVSPLYNVVLLDDDEHTYDYVVEMLMKLFLCSHQRAYQHALEVDSMKRTVVMTCEEEQANFAKDQIQGYGADWRMEQSKGSMTAIIEPATVQ